MKEYLNLKNKNSYYVIIPAVIAVWSVLLLFVFLPAAKNGWEKEKIEYQNAQKQIEKILTLDPERLEYAKTQKDSSKFDYANAIDSIARLCGIPAANYKLNSGMIVQNRSNQKTQDATVILDKVNIEKFAQFLSTVQLRWPNLQCIQSKLTKIQGVADTWKADLRFRYYY